VRFAFGRGLRLALGVAAAPASAPPANAPVHDLGEPEAPGGDGVEVPFGEELLRDCLASFPHVRLTVTGRCMEPAIAHGEKVHLVSASRRRPRVGQHAAEDRCDRLRGPAPPPARAGRLPRPVRRAARHSMLTGITT